MSNAQSPPPMESLWRNTGSTLGRHWKIVLAVVVALTAVLAIGLTRLEFATGQDSYLNPDSQIALDNVEFQDRFGGETLILLFSAQDGNDITDLVTGDNLEKLRQLTAQLEEIPEAYAVVTPAVSLDFSDALLTGPARSALLSAGGREVNEDAAAARSADVQISLARLGAVDDQTIGSPGWTDVLLFGNDGYTVGDSGVDAPAPQDRSIRTSLGSTYPNLQTAVGGVVFQGNATLDEQTRGTEQVLDIIEQFDFEGFDLTPTGSPVYLREINDYLKGGMLTFGLAAFAIMAVILLVMFKVRWRLLPLLSVIVGVLWGFSLMGIIGIDLSLVTISGLPILIGLGIDFAIQMQNRFEEEVEIDRSEHPMAETLANLAPALITATVGAILAFFALQISQVPMIRDFGILLAVGVAMLLVAGIIVPVAVLGIGKRTASPAVKDPSFVEKLVVKLGSLSARVALPLIAASALLFVVGVVVEGDIEIQSDPIRWIDQSSQTVSDIERLTDETGFATTLGISIEANNVFADEVNQILWDFTQAAEARDEVISSSSLVGTMGKILAVDGATPLAPTPAEMTAAAEVMPPAIARALVLPDLTAAQVNLRIADASLDERAVLIAELEADLQQRIAEYDFEPGSILLTGLGDDSEAIRAVPSGLAAVGVGLLENLSANRAILTYIGLAIVALWLLARYRSLPRVLIALVPVLLAVGVSTIIVSVFGLTLSPLTTVSGPLVIATCAEFSVLILTRYLEERQRGLEPQAATDTAAARTGQAFFTSAATTIGGFAVLIGSSLPLLRDFGIIVTLNVAVALLAALVVMPPVMVWADERGLLGTDETVSSGAVVLASKSRRAMVGAGVGAVAVAAATIGLYIAADTGSGQAEAFEYAAVALPTPVPTPTPIPTAVPDEPDVPADEPADTIDVSTFGTEAPSTGVVGPILFGFITTAGADPQSANCTIETLLDRTTEEELLAAGLATFTPESMAPVLQAAQDCGLTQEEIAGTLEAAGVDPSTITIPATGEPATDEPTIDVSTFGADSPSTGVVGPILFGFITTGGADAQSANCTIETLLDRTTEEELLAAGLATFTPESMAPVLQAAQDCGLTQEQIDGTLEAAGAG